jgi:nicotinamide riboside transporter PnuC
MGKLSKNQRGYSAVEALLILVALALVAFVGWYVHHATTQTNKTYSISESSQKPAAKKPATTTKTTTGTSTTSTTPATKQ